VSVPDWLGRAALLQTGYVDVNVFYYCSVIVYLRQAYFKFSNHHNTPYLLTLSSCLSEESCTVLTK